MTFVTLANGFSYDKALLDTLKTAKRFEAQRLATLRSTAHLTPEQAGWARYGAWMQGRRSGDFESFHLEQRVELHTLARTFGGHELNHEVCTCGLAVAVPRQSSHPELAVSSVNLNRQPGHIRVSDQTLQTIFVVHSSGASEMSGFKYVYFCQTCGVLGAAAIVDLKAENDDSAAQLAELRRTHRCDPTIESAQAI